jgi:A/G-specific adenine glycosylase
MKYLLFSDKILFWYSIFKRDLPWRHTKDPYKIWISEVILQQTRVNQGLSYYKRFINSYPNVFLLAAASEDDVLKLWQGLGYYSRARNMHKGANYIVSELNGIFPKDPARLIKIPGVGSYTAAAVASIAFNVPVATLDGNVYRVLSRFFNVDTAIDTGEGKRFFDDLSNRLVDKKNPGTYNQALMDFGAIQCKPKNPNCLQCPLSEQCGAFTNGKVDLLPVKVNLISKKKRFFNYLVIETHNKLIFERRTENDIWKNLFEFPLIETKKMEPIEKIANSPEWKSIFKDGDVTLVNESDIYKHVLSHREIYARFIHIKTDAAIALKENMITQNINEEIKLPVARLTEKYINTFRTG